MAPADPQGLSKRDLEALDRIAATREEDAIERALVAARERLGMDAGYLTTMTSESQRVTELSGDSSGLGFGTGTEIPIEDTYCARMLRGDLTNIVPDTSEEPAVRGLAMTAHVGSWVGVPVTLADGSLHGTLCCASSEPRSGLGHVELAFMHVLAGILGRRIDQARELVDGRVGESRMAGEQS